MKPCDWIHFQKFCTVLAGVMLGGINQCIVQSAAYARAQAPMLLTSIQALASAPLPPKDPKLSSALRELRDQVPQETLPLAAASLTNTTRNFSPASLSKSLADVLRAGRMRIDQYGDVQVYLELSQLSDANLEALRGLGIQVQVVGQPTPDKAKGEVLAAVPTVQAMLPVAMIAQAEALPFVRYIRLPDYPVLGSSSGSSEAPIDSQGDSILQAQAARSMYNVSGTGIRVGVISDGIGGIYPAGCTSCDPLASGASDPNPDPVVLGNLPETVGTRNSSGVLIDTTGGIIAQSFRTDGNLEACIAPCETTSGEGAEGTAMLEVVHDLAPGAQLYFANQNSSMEMEQAEDFLAANTDVVVTDLFYFTPPFDGTSPVSANTSGVLNDNGNPIRAFFTAVGNFAQDHYQGMYQDSMIAGAAFTGEQGDLHLFSGAVPGPQPLSSTVDNDAFGAQPFDPLVVIPSGQTVEIYLAWNDPTAGSSNDYDLFLVPLNCPSGYTTGNLPLRPCTISGAALASSTNPQTGTQDPAESLAWTNLSTQKAYVGVVIQNVQNAALPRTFDLFVHGYMDKENLPNHNFDTAQGSVPSISDAAGSPVGVLGVGAIDQSQCPSPGDCTGFVEMFSSQGPTEATPQQTTGTMKPDLIAVDDVCITGAGDFGNGAATDCPPAQPTTYMPQRFGGTSAAAPHAAAIAALTLQAAPCLLFSSPYAIAPATARANLRKALTSQAITLPGVLQIAANNNADIEGNGLIDAYLSVMSMLPTATAGSSVLVNATSTNGTTTVLNVTYSDPNLCPATVVQWTGTCGSGSATGTSTVSGTPSVTAIHAPVSCPVGVNTVAMSVSNNGITFSQPDLSAYTVTVTDFALSASPGNVSVAPGAPALYTVDVASTPQGGFTNPVALACTNGLPPGATCLFSPSTATPATTSSSGTVTPVTATSTLTIYTPGQGLISPRARGKWPLAPIPTLWSIATFFLAVFAIWLKASRRTLGFRWALGALVVLAAVAPAACGGGSSGSNSSSGPQNYTVTITGTSNQLQHSTTVTLNVQ